MPTLEQIKSQLRHLGLVPRFFGKAEVAELPQILGEREQILGAVLGAYEAGVALMLLTNRRLLFLDKSFYHFRCDEVLLNMIGSVDYNTGLLTGKIKIGYGGGELHLWRVPNRRLRQFSTTLEAKIESSNRGPTKAQPELQINANKTKGLNLK